ncbi:Lar family restriction alleviation protein [Mesorhizobium sp.]|uniref:Lar family restriction alleviation protein n=1 Tax=Mesorhizobium sp. TaxID=1871066 RepID=UPI002579947F|nr:Lar family restriction alleviation protein [Mesorhizobium sp.]
MTDPTPAPYEGSADLKPCPFCGGKAAITDQEPFCVECCEERCNVDGPCHADKADAIAAWNLRAALASQPVPAVAVKPFGLDDPGVETLRSNGLKPEEISGDAVSQAERVRELLHWFLRLSRGSANPKWTREHAFELAYYIATTDNRASIDTHAIAMEAWLKGVKATHAERDQMLRLGFITKAEFDAALAPATQAVPDMVEALREALALIDSARALRNTDVWSAEAKNLEARAGDIIETALTAERESQPTGPNYWPDDLRKAAGRFKALAASNPGSGR